MEKSPPMTADTLNTYSYKDLVDLAKARSVPGWHAMRKDQLVRAILKANAARSKSKSSAEKRTIVAKPMALRNGITKSPLAGSSKAGKNGAVTSAKSGSHSKSNGRAVSSDVRVDSGGKAASKAAATAKRSRLARRLEQVKANLQVSKNLATNKSGTSNGHVKDRLVVMVRDPFWLQAYWELSRNGVERAQAAMGQEWHSAKPILRVWEVSTGGTTSSAEAIVRDIEVHGGVSNWYVDVQEPPRSYRLDIGYRAPSGRFFVMARSNVVTTPKPGSSDAIDENWSDVAENFDKIYAMSGGYSPDGRTGELQELFEERLRRPMGAPLVTRFGPGAEGLLPHRKDFSFEVDAELIVFGVTEPDAHVTLQGEPVKVRQDGTFTVRFSLPNCRQVIPAVASSRDGVEQRTIVLAVERNTKLMEPLIRDGNEV